MSTLYRKVITVSPRQVKDLSFHEASQAYTMYVWDCYQQGYFANNKLALQVKSIEEWLKTPSTL